MRSDWTVHWTAGALCGTVALAIASMPTAACSASSAPGGGAGDTDAGSDGGMVIDFDGAPMEDAGACEGIAEQAEYVPPVIQMILDTSGSMLEDAPGGGGSKWVVTRKALNAAINGAGGLPDVAAVGITYFPGAMGIGNGPCINNEVAVPIAPLGAAQRQEVTTSLSAQMPSGPTPAHDAYFFGGSTLNQSKQAGNRFLLFVTDGEATHGEMCSDMPDDDALVQLVTDAAAGGTPTFVVGSPGSEPAREVLSRMASAGGTAPAGCSDTGPDYCHFDMTASTDLAADLGDALSAITGATLGCEYEIPPPPAGQELDPGFVNVRVTSGDGAVTDLARDGSDTCSKGWVYSDDQARVVLCGADCDDVRQDATARVEISFGCRTRVL